MKSTYRPNQASKESKMFLKSQKCSRQRSHPLWKLKIGFAALLLVIPFSLAQAKSSYVSLIPYGNTLSCNTCHTSSFALNLFARDFKSNGYRWDATLAQKDSDGDGATNGVELQDPTGSWVKGMANPGTATLVTYPGDPSSVPVPSTPTNTPTPVVIPPTSTPTPVVAMDTPTPVIPDNTPTPVVSIDTPTPIVPTPVPNTDDFVAGIWTGNSVHENETSEWYFVLGNGTVTGTALITSYHEGDEEEGDDEEHDGESDDFSAESIHYVFEGTYALRTEGESRMITMDLTILHDLEMDSHTITGTVDPTHKTMSLHGFENIDALILNQTGDIPNPEIPTPTVTPHPIEPATPTPVRYDPYLVRRFTFDSQDEYTSIPGGYNQAEPAMVQAGPIPLEASDHTDGMGITITADPGEVGLIQLPPVEVEDSLVLVRVSVMSDEEGASIALASLDGSMDGSIAMTMAMKSGQDEEEYHRIVLVYDPPEDTVIPVVQLANPESNGKTVTLYIDNLEVYTIPKEGFTSNLLLNGK